MKRLLCCASTPALLLAMSTTAFAQAAPDAITLDQVVVTAQKRAENVQNVPLAVSVVTARQLESAGVKEFTDVSRVAPSLTIRQADQPINASVALRGIGTFAYGIGVEPSVAVQLDDVPVSFQARAFSDLTDVERIEVLRGPQSTLYGKSASAGLINIYTRDPSAKFSVLANVLATDDHEYRGAVSLSGPIGETLGYRISASRSEYDGNVKNLYDGQKINGRDETSIRGKLLWRPIDDLKVTLGVSYIDGVATSNATMRVYAPGATLRGAPGLTANVTMPGVVAAEENLDVSNDTPPYAKSEGFGQSLKVEYDLPQDFTLVSITSHDQFGLDDQLDSDRTSYAGIKNAQGGYFKAKANTQEVRLLSPGDGPFRYTLGLFYGDNDLRRSFKRGPFFSQAQWYAQATSENKAAFGQGEWTFLPKTTAIVGLRYQKEDIGYYFNDIYNGNAKFSGSASDSSSTYRLGLRHQMTDDVMVFGSYATGHKGQTYDLTTGFNQARADVGPIAPEESKSFEAGIKSQLLDHRIQLNGTVFHVKYDDYQAQGIDTIGGTQNFRLTNVGKVLTKGVEIEATAIATKDLRFNASAAYVDAKITSFPRAACWPGQTAAQGCVAGSPSYQDLKGATLPNAPKWKLNVGADFTRPIGDYEMLFSAAYAYQTKVNFSLNTDPGTVQKAYGVVNVSGGFRKPDGGYQVVAFVNNLFDKSYGVNGANQYGNFGSQTVTELQPARDFHRYAGVRLSLSY
ncbi:TonB-dependent receptor [Caulobacter sp.]|uniref:TonB-dependent receptor n=1 Tax=Caulobacter sp. TaxID=78 RepID=UPI003BB05039